MADNFKVVTQYPTIEFLGGSQSQSVMAVGYVSKPNGVYFEQRIARSIYAPSIVKAVGESYATIFETLFTVPGVSGVEWSQAQIASGALEDQVTIYVSSTSGNSTSSLTVAIAALGPKLHASQIAALRKQLDEAEAL